MATILAANTGNWSATGTWTGGVVPVAGDIVVANGKTVTIDTLNVTVAEVRNDTTGGAVAGGGFTMVSGGSLTANVYAGSTSTSCVTWAGTAGQTASITGNFFSASSAGGHAIICTGGNLTIGGGSQTTGSSGTSGSGINFNSSGTFIFATAGNPGVITGGNGSATNTAGIILNNANANATIYASTITGPASGSGVGLASSNSNQTVNITAGNIQNANATGYGIQFSGSGVNATLSVSGTIQGGAAAIGIYITNSGTINITVAGNIINGPGNSVNGINLQSNATLNITGNALGTQSVFGTNAAILLSSSGVINLTGSATAGNSYACYNNSTGIIRVTRAIGNGFGLGSVGIGNIVAVFSGNSGSLTYVEQLQFGSLGNTPISGPIRLTDNTGNVCQMVTTTGSIKTLVDTAATAGILPAVTDVRSGVTYSSGNRTGTCAVPAAGSVALGVAVDNTTGTAVLTAANVRTAVGLASANLDTQLTPLTNLDATVSSRSTYAGGDTSGTTTLLSRLTGTRATNLDNLDQPVSSRLATSGYTAPPTVGDITTAVWAAATRTLTTAIDNSATIAAAVWSYATGRTITGGTVDTLTNAPSVPSAATIASAVRTELTPELGRIDTTVSSRLAPSGTLARVTLTDTTTTLTNAPNVPSASTIAAAVWAAADKTGYSLTSAERTAIATAVEQAILNESDGQAILNAIVGAIGNQNIDQVALVAAIRADLERNGGTLATRLAASNYTAPPTAAANASAVRTELATELGRLDASVSSRLAPSGTLAHVTLVDTTTTLTNAPDVPTEAEIAAQVRTELSPELARVSNAATTQQVAEIVEGALQSLE